MIIIAQLDLVCAPEEAALTSFHSAEIVDVLSKILDDPLHVTKIASVVPWGILYQ